MKPVDCLGSEKVRRELKFLMPALQQEHPDVRHKAYVAVAWSFLRYNDLDEALKVLDLIPAEYVREVMPKQMSTDPAFDRMTEAVARALVDGQVHMPTYVQEYVLVSSQAAA